MMKTLLKTCFPALVPALILVSCGSSRNPEKVADKFLTAFNERKFDQAREVSTPETGKLIDLMENLTKLSGNADSTVGGKIVILGHTVEGEKAIVTFREEGSEDTQELHLKRVEGKWLVHVTKEDIANKDMPGGTKGEEGLLMEHDSLGTEAPDSLVAAP